MIRFFSFSKEHLHILISKEISFLLLKAHPYFRYQCSFALWTTLQSPNFCHDEIFLYYLATLNFDSFYTKICLRVHRWCLKKTPWKFQFKITFWKSETHFSYIEVQYSKNYFKIFLQDPEASGKKHLKGITTATPKVENIYIY